MSEPRTVTARWVFPVSGPPLERGTVTVRGDRIEAVEPRGTRTPDEDLGNFALIPGLVNAHTHLDLSGARGLIPPTDPDHFPDWLRGVIAYRRTRTPEQTQADIREGLAECLRSGTTLIGDIAASDGVWRALQLSELRFVVFREVIGLSDERASASWQDVIRWSDMLFAGNDDENGVPTTAGVTGISPHAPYSVSRTLFRRIAARGRNKPFPVAIHLAESPGEMTLIASGTGLLVQLLSEMGVWRPASVVGNIGELLRIYEGVAPVCWVHANYLPPDTRLPKTSTVVYCPRTHAAFGHPPHPFREFLARGVRVCLGTDSLASNPDLDVLAEAKLVRERHPEFPGDALLRMVTLSGAEALGWADEAGSLEPGKSADLVALPLPDRDAADPHELLFASVGERRTMFRGEWR